MTNRQINRLGEEFINAFNDYARHIILCPEKIKQKKKRKFLSVLSKFEKTFNKGYVFDDKTMWFYYDLVDTGIIEDIRNAD